MLWIEVGHVVDTKVSEDIDCQRYLCKGAVSACACRRCLSAHVLQPADGSSDPKNLLGTASPPQSSRKVQSPLSQVGSQLISSSAPRASLFVHSLFALLRTLHCFSCNKSPNRSLAWGSAHSKCRWFCRDWRTGRSAEREERI